MPRPTSTGRRITNTSSGNSFTKWLAGRKERKKAAEEEAALTIINDAAKNEGTFITMLQQIRFHESKLPKEKLEYRSKENQRYGDLEYCARWLEQQIAKNSSPVCFDIRPLDRKLYQVVARYKEAIELGYPETAFAARAALVDVFTKIRFRLPQVSPEENEQEFARTYVERCCEHIDTWINLLSQELDADKTAEAIAKEEAELEKKEKLHEAKLDALEKMIEEDPSKLSDYLALSNATAETELTASQKRLKDDMIEQHVQTAVFAVYQKQVSQLRHIRTVITGRVEALKAAVLELVIPTDANSLNKYKDEIAKMRERMAARDQEIEESLKDFEDLQGAIQSMEDLPGAVQARQAAAASAMTMIENLKKRQEARIKEPVSGQYLMEIFGLKSKEEMEEVERQRQKAEEIIRSRINQTEDENQLNYNG
ncbi:MAG: hypothetical protein IKT58_00940 [Oscillospiraceae bacterium]|nr:hypothetical protein [Oscillospiraceae bacterium]